MPLSSEIFQNRRTRLMANLPNNALIILSTNTPKVRNSDVYYPYRGDSDFLYLTGFGEPDAIAFITAQKYVLFLRERNLKREIWEGPCLGTVAAKEMLFCDEAYPIGELEDKLPRLLGAGYSVYFDANERPQDLLVQNALKDKPQSLAPYIHEMRLIKDLFEIELMKCASAISVKAHERTMLGTRVGSHEYEIQSILDATFTSMGVEHAYPPIVAGGGRATVLHYILNNQVLEAGELLLIDAGCEVEGYASDISRTFPVSGRFSEVQAKLYEIVLSAQMAAIETMKPGVDVREPHRTASGVLEEGLGSLGLLNRGLTLQNFYMHGTGHWLGLDVHDVGSNHKGLQKRLFEPGMVMTVEPGLYIRPQEGVSEVYHNIGIRIEDDVLITDEGNLVLTAGLVKNIGAIEGLMG